MKKHCQLYLLLLVFSISHAQTTKLGYRDENPMQTQEQSFSTKARQIYQEIKRADPVEYAKNAAQRVKTIVQKIKQAKNVQEKQMLSKEASLEAMKATLVSAFPISLSIDFKKLDTYFEEALKAVIAHNGLTYAQRHTDLAEQASRNAIQAKNKKEQDASVRETLQEAFKVMVANGLLRKKIEDSGFTMNYEDYISLRDDHLAARGLADRARVAVQLATEAFSDENKKGYLEARRKFLTILDDAELARTIAKEAQQTLFEDVSYKK